MSKTLLSGAQQNKRRKLIASVCLLCKEECKEECKSNEVGWNNLEEKAKNWSCLDTFGGAFDRVNWEDGPQGMYVHSNCKIKLFNSRSLEQAKQRKEKEKEKKSENEEEILTQSNSPVASSIVTRRSTTGLVHSKHLCIWCMKPEDARHKDRKNSKLHLLNQVRFV